MKILQIMQNITHAKKDTKVDKRSTCWRSTINPNDGIFIAQVEGMGNEVKMEHQGWDDVRALNILIKELVYFPIDNIKDRN